MGPPHTCSEQEEQGSSPQLAPELHPALFPVQLQEFPSPQLPWLPTFLTAAGSPSSVALQL